MQAGKMRYKEHYREDKNHLHFILQLTLFVTFSSMVIVTLVNCVALASNRLGKLEFLGCGACLDDSSDKRVNLFVAKRGV